MSDIKKFSGIMLLFLLGIICACSKDRSPEQDSNFAYFPLSSGQTKEYDVQRTFYSLSSLPETQHFTTKQVVVDTFKMESNQLAYKIEHFTQNNKAIWKLDSINSAWQTYDKTFSMENGQIILNMINPLSNGLIWNGNQTDFQDRTAS